MPFSFYTLDSKRVTLNFHCIALKGVKEGLVVQESFYIREEKRAYVVTLRQDRMRGMNHFGFVPSLWPIAY